MYRHLGLWAKYLGNVDLLTCFDGEGGGGGGADEAVKKANQERDFANAKLTKLETELADLKKLVPTADQAKRMKELEDAAAQADEDKKKKAGEWEVLKTDLVTKHNTELAKLQDEIKSLGGVITNGEIDRAFGSAFVDKSPLFGGDDALTVLPGDLAARAFREYVSVEMKDGKPVLTVKDGKGKVVIDPKTGDPMSFGPALLEVINGLPTKDRILRGSGKTGSGSSGGEGNKDKTVNYSHLTPEQMRDPAIIAESKRRTAAAGGIVMGEAFDRLQSAKK